MVWCNQVNTAVQEIFLLTLNFNSEDIFPLHSLLPDQCKKAESCEGDAKIISSSLFEKEREHSSLQ